MVASQMSGKKTIGLKELVLDVLGVEMTKISDLIGTGSKQISFDRLPIDERVRDYACADADLPLRLVPVFEEALQEGRRLGPLRTRWRCPLLRSSWTCSATALPWKKACSMRWPGI